MKLVHPLFERAFRVHQKPLLYHGTQHFTYGHLLGSAVALSKGILSHGRPQVVASLCPNSFEYVAAKYAIWTAGATALPLHPQHPPNEWEYFLRDAQVGHLLVHPGLVEKVRPLIDSIRIPYSIISTDIPSASVTAEDLPVFEPSSDAIIVYTSGTTGKPKGVVHTHSSIMYQVTALVDAWKYSDSDHLLHVLPLHHVHGIVNALLCPLYAQASLEFLPGNKVFDADPVWKLFGRSERQVTLFMGVPAMYSALLKQFGTYPEDKQKLILDNFRRHVRLTVSGSSALPVSVFDEWVETVWSGHEDDPRSRILERYGMTEIGMALTNPLHGERIPGTVGNPFPNVQVKLIDKTRNVEVNAPNEPGELWVKSPTVFKEYLGRPEAARETMSPDGWFMTGDTASRVETPAGKTVYKILGRTSVDILKVSGYKISALDIEREIMAHPNVDECAVIGTPDVDPAKGDQILAIVVLKSGLLV